MSNRTKDKIYVTLFLVGIAVLIILVFAAIVKSFAVDEPNILSEQEYINKFYTEERIKNEMGYLAAWQTIESMTEEEYEETFYTEDRQCC